MKFHYNPCKYWCFGIFLLLQHACVWLQWLGFRGKHSILCIRGFNYQAPHKEFACFPIIPHQKLSNRCILQAICSYIWEISPFSLQKWFWGYFAKGIWQNFTYFPTKIIYIIVVFLLHHCIKLKFYAFCVFALANYVFCGIFIPKCQIPCYM